MAHYKIVKIPGNTIVASYDDVNPFAGPMGREGSGFTSLLAPANADPNGMVVFDDGVGNLSLIFDQTTLDGWQRSENKKALDTFTAQITTAGDAQIDALLSSKSENLFLAESLAMVFAYLAALQDAMGVQDSDLSTEGQQAKTVLLATKTDVYDVMQSILSTEDSDITAFAPPHPGVTPLYPA